jgi:hypothetical protein
MLPQKDAFCEESSDACLCCPDVESTVGLVLNVFDLPLKRGATSIACNQSDSGAALSPFSN